MKTKIHIHWTPELDSVIQERRNQGKTFQEIGQELGTTKTAIGKRFYYLRYPEKRKEDNAKKEYRPKYSNEAYRRNKKRDILEVHCDTRSTRTHDCDGCEHAVPHKVAYITGSMNTCISSHDCTHGARSGILCRCVPTVNANTQRILRICKEPFPFNSLMTKTHEVLDKPTGTRIEKDIPDAIPHMFMVKSSCASTGEHKITSIGRDGVCIDCGTNTFKKLSDTPTLDNLVEIDELLTESGDINPHE